MRTLFPGYYRPAPEELRRRWANAVFVFDTNVLLDLYSYPEAARDIFFSVLNKIADRTWIPYQTALEFHRNRFNRIRQANKPVLQLLDLLESTSAQVDREFKSIEYEKRNTGIEDISERLDGITKAHKALSDAVKLACDRLPQVSLNDPIGNHIASIFQDRVGPRPANQAALDKLVADGEERYSQKIPPGFGDAKKGDQYRDRNIIYQAKFGDLLLWRQLINYAKEEGKLDIILITGDRKPDWWWIEEGQALGPLPELVQEFLSESGATSFSMYSAHQFLENAEDYLHASEVTKETIEQVKETSTVLHYYNDRDYENYLRDYTKQYETTSLHSGWEAGKLARTFQQYSDNFELRSLRHAFAPWSTKPIAEWLSKIFPKYIIENCDYPDYLVKTPTGFHGFEVEFVDELSRNRADEALTKGAALISDGKIEKFSLIIVLTSKNKTDADAENSIHTADLFRDTLAASRITSIICGNLHDDTFTPTYLINGV